MIWEQDAGLSVTEICRKYGIGQSTFLKWKSKFCGMDVSDVQRLKTLEQENNLTKRLLADAMLGISALKDVASKNF